jgi:hypothetical protein
MRTIKLLFIIPCLLFVFSACQKDNYQAPNATISGALTDAELGGPLSLSQNGSGGSVRYLVNDLAKYPSPSALDCPIKQDGTFFNSQYFAENYKVFPLAASGPWQYTNATDLTKAGDSLRVNVAAGQNTVSNFKVYPYFRISLSVVDTNCTVTITRSAAATVNANNLTDANDLVIYVNNYALVNSAISSNSTGYYINQWRFTINNTSTPATTWATGTTQAYTFGTPLTLPIKTTAGGVLGVQWAVTHLAKGTYYWRASIVGHGSNGAANYSNTVIATVH